MAGRYQEQHPIPQNISSYQFRLVGDMTLKQFFQVAGGALVALLLYSTELVAFIKWPLMFISFLFGVALAFFPLEDRPLEKWIVLFFKAIYSPTRFKWTKSKHISYFADEGAQTPQTQQPVQPQPAIDSTKISAPVGMHQEATTAQDELENTEQEFLTSISQQMIANPIQISADNTQHTDNTTQSVPAQKTQDQQNEDIKPSPDVEQIHIKTHAPEPQSEPIMGKHTPTEQDSGSQSSYEEQQSTDVNQFAPNVAAPITPTRENLVVGQIMDINDNVLENAILEIRDTDGRPARALKTNKLGHFGIVTPLSEGSYEMTVEKDGYEFDPITIEVHDEILKPIAIRAKSKFSNKEE